MPSRLPSLRLLTLNVNGLRGERKRHTLFLRLLRGPWDVVLLQETHHHDEDEARRWTSEGAGPSLAWQGPAFWSEGEAGRSGVAVLIRPACAAMDVRRHPVAAAGRMLRVDFTFQGTPMAVASVYAPCAAAERRQFFAGPAAACLHGIEESRRPLLGGDFNCIEDTRDQLGGPASSRRMQGMQGGLALLQARHDLHDVWRQLHPDGADFTHQGTPGFCSPARLDRWLIAGGLSGAVASCTSLVGLPGDHLGVELLLLDRDGPDRGPGSWTMPLWYLDDRSFCDQMTAHIRAFLLDKPLSPELSRNQRWDMLKATVQHLCIAFGTQRARQRRAEEAAFSRQAQTAKAAFIADPSDVAATAAWRSAQAALQDFHEARSKLAAQRAGALWHACAEQPTFFFHRVTRERQLATSVTALQTGDGLDAQGCPATVLLNTVEGRVRAGRAWRDFYAGDRPGGLYAVRPTSRSAQDLLLSTLDASLPAGAASACEAASLSPSQLRRALDSMPKGKRPGPDGLPYEFYQTFWEDLGGELSHILAEAHAGGPADSALPASMRQGLIVPIFKAGDRTDPARYRPITLLNADYKVTAKALALCIAPALATVVDDTQTAFIPGRWIGDNVLAHLEEVDYCQDVGQPGCLLFLDFAKAYDRVDRPWLLRCMRAIGFGDGVLRWIQLMTSGTSAHVMCNGWRSPELPVCTGLWQGSPLSPVLYTIAAQPLASILRSLVAGGRVRAISMPDGSPAPISHQHADDTSLHTRSRADSHIAVEEGVRPFCAASGAEVSLEKSKGLLLGGGDAFQGVDPLTGAFFPPPGEPIRHLGILVGTDTDRCRTELFQRLQTLLYSRIARWSSIRLTFLGRVYVAKQVMASMLSYHATFITPSAGHMRRLATMLAVYVGQGAAWAPGDAVPCLHPSRAVCAMPWAEGGVGMADLRSMVPALNCWKSAAVDGAEASWCQAYKASLYKAVDSKCVQDCLRPSLYSPHIKCHNTSSNAWCNTLRNALPHLA